MQRLTFLQYKISIYILEMISELFFLVCGMYIGKYYPEYIPIPRIHQSDIDALLAYIKSIQTSSQTATTPTNELKTN